MCGEIFFNDGQTDNGHTIGAGLWWCPVHCVAKRIVLTKQTCATLFWLTEQQQLTNINVFVNEAIKAIKWKKKRKVHVELTTRQYFIWSKQVILFQCVSDVLCFFPVLVVELCVCTRKEGVLSGRVWLVIFVFVAFAVILPSLPW